MLAQTAAIAAPSALDYTLLWTIAGVVVAAVSAWFAWRQDQRSKKKSSMRNAHITIAKEATLDRVTARDIAGRIESSGASEQQPVENIDVLTKAKLTDSKVRDIAGIIITDTGQPE